MNIKTLGLTLLKYGLGMISNRIDMIIDADSKEQMKREIIEELRGEKNGSKNA